MTQKERIEQLENIVANLQSQLEALQPPAPPTASPDGDELNSIVREVWIMKKMGATISVEDQQLYQAAVDADYQPYKEGHPDLELFYKSEEYLNRSK